MSGQAEAGWFKQDDGSQRYWDGTQWTEHRAPADPPESEVSTAVDARPLWKKKRFIIPMALIAFFILLCAIGIATAGGGSDDEPQPTASASPTPTPTTSPEPEQVAMPDVVAMNLQDAQDLLDGLGLVEVESADASDEDRVVLLAANWQVCEQAPAPGGMVSVDTAVVLSVVKDDEYCPGDEPEEVEEVPEPEAPEQPEEPEISVSQQQAVRKANEYLDFTAFSRSGLIDQLEFEGFPSDDAEFAVDNIVVDWNEQAALKAQDYLDFTSFSRAGLIDQLIFEGFTRDQAEYGVDEVGL